MKLSIHIPLFLTLGLATNARRFIHRSEIVPPSSCIPKSQIPVKSSTDIPPVKVPTSSSGQGVPPVISGSSTAGQNSTASSSGQKVPPVISGNSTVDQNSNSTIPLINTNSTGVVNGTLISRGFSRGGFPSFLLGWQDLCLASGGDILSVDSPCFFGNTHAFDALLATADVCAQQDVADAMITFAKSKGILNRNDLISFAIGYRQLPRQAVRILGVVPATPYCLRAPINSELIRIVNKQTEGVVIGVYGGPNYPMIKFGSRGSCPFGTQPDVSSCTCAQGKVISSGSSSGSSNGTVVVGGSSDGTNSTTTDSGSSNSTETSTASNSTATDSTAGGSNSTETGTSSDSSAGNSTQTDSTGGSTGNSTDTGSTDSTGTDSGHSTGTDSTSMDDGSSPTETDSSDSTGTDSTDESSSADNSGGGETTQASQSTTASTSTATDDGGFDGNINDPNGR
ncbi:hypothetical protein L218DRAFT_986277 [Marasmius fiardii PR-910]|nr:hypothetical protein L218DRAFT_986277 [Marasmius fiardii PR-910]